MGVVNIYSGLGERTNWKVSKSKDHVLTATILNNSAAFDISSYTFVAKFYTLDGLKIATPFLTLTQGSGITNGGATGIITITLTDTQTNLTANEYYWELTTTAPTDDRWFNGVFEIVDYLWDSGNSSGATVNLTTGGNNLTINLTLGGGSVTLSSLGTTLQTAAADTPLDADTWNFYDAVDAVLKKITWANIKAALKTYFDTLYDANGAASTVQSNLSSHTSNTSNPHGVTKEQLGATTVGGNIFSLTNPSAITFLRMNADNTVTALSADNFRTALGIVQYLSVPFLANAFNPADATDYYFGGMTNLFAPSTTTTDQDFTIGYNCTVIGCIIQAHGNTTQGSSEDVAISLRNNTAVTLTAIGNFKTNATSAVIVSTAITGISISVSANDFICLQINGTWATNPQGVRLTGYLIVRI